MSDKRLRELQRAWKTSPTDENGYAYLSAKIQYEPDLFVKLINRVVQLEKALMRVTYGVGYTYASQSRGDLGDSASVEEMLAWLELAPRSKDDVEVCEQSTSLDPIQDVALSAGIPNIDTDTIRGLAGLPAMQTDVGPAAAQADDDGGPDGPWLI